MNSPPQKNMKTQPVSSVDHTQTSNPEHQTSTPINQSQSVRLASGRRKKPMGSLAVLLVFVFALLSTTQVKSGERHDQDRRDSKLIGTWDVTLRFPVCDAACPCPGGVPNIPIATLNTYGKDGTLVVANGSLLAGPGHGWWERIDHSHYIARFKFFIFNATGVRVGSEIVTKNIHLTGPDTFEATSTFDLFDAAGNVTAQGCIINETATRFE